MRHRSFLHLATALLGIVFVLFTSACAKKDDVAPAPATTGQLAGTLSPVGSASAVTATAADGRTQSAVPDATTGAFAFAALAPGAYQLSATPAVGFNRPDALPVTVTAGTTTTGNLRLVRDGRIRGTCTWEQNGILHVATALFGTINPNNFSLDATEELGGGRYRSVHLSLTSLVPNGPYNFAGVGTYPLGLSQWTSAGCESYIPNQATDYDTTAYANSPVGQVVVSSFSLSARTLTGTFDFRADASLASSSTTPTSQTISNGRFDITF